MKLSLVYFILLLMLTTAAPWHLNARGAADLQKAAAPDKSYRVDITAAPLTSTIQNAAAIVVAHRENKFPLSSSHDQTVTYTFKVVQSLKGDVPDFIEVQSPGSTMPFSPQKDLDYLLFLTSQSNGGTARSYGIMSHALTTALIFPVAATGQLGGRKPPGRDWQNLTLDKVKTLIASE
ncbi:hypothetical protein [Paremcibacter congregatus]|uniref:hypothetical protein n=1 Tax=Paremcibacter congregatus TaxID=2043170 RepID=UPI003A8FEF7B